MDKKWALKNVDPYLHEAKTPFSPPEHTGSGFIVTDNQVQDSFSAEQQAEIRAVYTQKIRKIINDTGDAANAEDAKSFYEAHRTFFSTDDAVVKSLSC